MALGWEKQLQTGHGVGEISCCASCGEEEGKSCRVMGFKGLHFWREITQERGNIKVFRELKIGG